MRERAGCTSPTRKARGSCRSGPTRSTIVGRSRPSRAPASSARRTRRATAAFVRRSTHTVRRGRRRCMAVTESSTSRRCSPRTCRASLPRGLSPRCRRNTCSGASPTAPTTGRGGSARSAPRRGVPFRSARCESPARSSRSVPTGPSRASTLVSVWQQHGFAVRLESATAVRTTTRRSTVSPLSRATRRAQLSRSARKGGSVGFGPAFAADLTVFAEDPVECDPDELPDLPVVLTVVDGEIVHRAG